MVSPGCFQPWLSMEGEPKLGHHPTPCDSSKGHALLGAPHRPATASSEQCCRRRLFLPEPPSFPLSVHRGHTCTVVSSFTPPTLLSLIFCEHFTQYNSCTSCHLLLGYLYFLHRKETDYLWWEGRRWSCLRTRLLPSPPSGQQIQ